MAVGSLVLYLLCVVLRYNCVGVGNSTDMPTYGITDGKISDSTSTRYNQALFTKQLVSELSGGRRTHFSVSISTDTVVYMVDRRFLSFGLGTSRISLDSSTPFQLNCSTALTLARGLSPAIFRVGGRSADETLFVQNVTKSDIPHRLIEGNAVVNYIITGSRWRQLNEFVNNAGLDLAFTLNLMIRDGNSWDPTNAKELLEFNAKFNYQVIWELGNEPILFEKNYNMTITARQLAKDFNSLRRILDRKRLNGDSVLVGPDVTHLHIHDMEPLTSNQVQRAGEVMNVSAFLERFLEDAGPSINATTVHFYNLRDNNSTSIENFTDPDVLDRTTMELTKIHMVMRAALKKESLPLWLGESSTISSGGFSTGSGRFVAGFIILNNLGTAARMKVDVFIYWNLYGGGYSLITKTYTPKPLYWVFLLYKRLVGTGVLSVKNSVHILSREGMFAKNATRYVRVFAHCTAQPSSNPEGAVTLIVLNMLTTSSASLRVSGTMNNKTIDEYHLTPHGGRLTASHIKLNGEKLSMVNHTLPELIPRPLSPGAPIVLRPMTYGFYVIKDANAPACVG